MPSLIEVWDSRLGVTEIAGPEHNPIVLQWCKDAGHPEIIDDETVMHNLVTHIDGRAIGFECGFDDVDCPHNAGAKAARRAEQNRQFRTIIWGGTCCLGHVVVTCRTRAGLARPLFVCVRRGEVKQGQPIGMPDTP